MQAGVFWQIVQLRQARVRQKAVRSLRDANSGLRGLTQIDYIFFGRKKIKRPADNRVPRNINANSIAVNGRLDAAVVQGWRVQQQQRPLRHLNLFL